MGKQLTGEHNRITKERFERAKRLLKVPADDVPVGQELGFKKTTACLIRTSKDYEEYLSRVHRFHGHPRGRGAGQIAKIKTDRDAARALQKEYLEKQDWKKQAQRFFDKLTEAEQELRQANTAWENLYESYVDEVDRADAWRRIAVSLMVGVVVGLFAIAFYYR